MSATRKLYLDMVKKYITGQLFNSANDPEMRNELISIDLIKTKLEEIEHEFSQYFKQQQVSISDLIPINYEAILQSLIHMNPPSHIYTLSSEDLLQNVLILGEQVIEENIPGDFIETGCWRGGILMLMKAILASYQISDRKVWGADSFLGLPEPDPNKNLKDAIWYKILSIVNRLRASRHTVEEGFRRLGILDNQVRMLVGWFHETLPKADIKQLAILRLDGDWYDSTKCVLECLYPKLSIGGYVIIDDYHLPTDCWLAVDEYREEHKIHEPMITVGKQAVYWRKEI